MALLTSGYIALGGNVAGRSVAKELNDGAPNFTSTISLNDGNVRSLAQRTGSVSISLSHLRGKSNALDTQTVTTGHYYMSFYGSSTNFYGYYLNGFKGSISDGTFNVKSGANIYHLYWSQSGTSNGIVSFSLSGTHSNSGWTTMSISGNQSFNRTSASFHQSSGLTTWNWTPVTTNQFGSSGSTRTVTFT